MPEQPYFSDSDIDVLNRLFARLGQWGSFEVDFQGGHAVTAHIRLTFKAPLPRWVRLLSAASPETLAGRPP